MAFLENIFNEKYILTENNLGWNKWNLFKKEAPTFITQHQPSAKFLREDAH